MRKIWSINFISLGAFVQHLKANLHAMQVYEVKQDMLSIKNEIDSVQLVKEEIDDIRESIDRIESEGERRKAKLLEQVNCTRDVQRFQ